MGGGGTKEMVIEEKKKGEQCSMLIISLKGSVLCDNEIQGLVILECGWWGVRGRKVGAICGCKFKEYYPLKYRVTLKN